jgi:hypothetical protein
VGFSGCSFNSYAVQYIPTVTEITKLYGLRVGKIKFSSRDCVPMCDVIANVHKPPLPLAGFRGGAAFLRQVGKIKFWCISVGCGRSDFLDAAFINSLRPQPTGRIVLLRPCKDETHHGIRAFIFSPFLLCNGLHLGCLRTRNSFPHCISNRIRIQPRSIATFPLYAQPQKFK